MTRKTTVGVGLTLMITAGGMVAATATSTAASPPTTVEPAAPASADPVGSAEADVSAAAQRAWEALVAAVTEPGDPDATAALDRLFTAGGPARVFVDDFNEALAADGLALRDNPDISASLTVEQVIVLGAGDTAGTTGEPPATQPGDAVEPDAELVVCAVDSTVLYEPASTADGTDTIVDDRARAAREVWHMVLDGEDWKLHATEPVDEWTDTTECPAPEPPATTASAPPTTLDPIAAEEAAVTEAAIQARLVGTEAFINLDDPSALAALDQYFVTDGPARQSINQQLQELRELGWRVRQHPTIPESLTVDAITFLDGSSPTQAELVVCVIDSVVVYEPVSDDGVELIVNDTVSAYRQVYLMTKEGNLWKEHSEVTVNEWEGLTECPDGS